MTTTAKTLLLAAATLAVAGGDDDSSAADETSSMGADTGSSTDAPATDDASDDSAESTGPSDDDSSSSGDPPIDATNIEKAVALIAAFESGDPAALDYVSDSYTQHNLAFPDGKEVLAGLLTGAPTGFETETVRVFEDGDFVFMHNVFGGVWNEGTPQVTFDVFRFDDEGLIAEHWDNLSDVVEDGDGTSQTDGPTEASSLGETEDNRVFIEEALQTLFVEGQWSQIDAYFDLEGYIQHSVGFGADSTGLQELLGSLPDGTPFYSSVQYVYVMGNMALTLSEGFPAEDTGLSDAYYDLFRIEDGLIVEHWDIIQTIPAEEDWANSNGKW